MRPPCLPAIAAPPPSIVRGARNRTAILGPCSVALLRVGFADRIPALALVAGLAACTDKEPAGDQAEAAATDGAAPSEAPTAIDLWAGVPPLQPEPDDVRADLKPEPGPAKPDTVSEVVELPFPPEAPPSETGSTTPPPGGPLHVERFGPEGEQGVVDAVRLSFDHPMVPLAAVAELEAKDVPLTINPAIPGHPQWLGTRTLAWLADGRIPFSTTYHVEVPAGTAATDGATLDEAVTWSFSTPALALESTSPYDGQDQVDLEPTVVLTFNQPVQRTALLAALRMTGGSGTVELTEEPAPALPEGATPPEPWETARVVRLKPKAALRPNTRYTLKLPRGVFGEGPEPSKPMRWSFSTYAPLRLSQQRCDPSPCRPEQGIGLHSTTVVADPRLLEKVHVEPEVEDLSAWASGNTVWLQGDFEGQQTYTVEVDAGLTDVHGQTLARPFRTRVKLGALTPSLGLASAQRSPGVIEVSATGPVLPLRVAGLKQLDVSGRALSSGAEIIQFFDAWPEGEDRVWPSSEAAPTWTSTVDVSASRRHRQTRDLDLAPLLGTEPGNAWVMMRSEPYTQWGWTQRASVSTLVTVTDLGIAAALDAGGGVVAVTRLSDGTPVPGAEIALLDGSGTTRWNGTTDILGQAYPDLHQEGIVAIVAEQGDDRSFLRVDQSDLRGRWFNQQAPSDQPRALIYTDRTPYKPGETIHLVGIVRLEEAGPRGGVAQWRTDTTGNYVVTAPRGIEVAKGEVEIGPLGTFTVDIPTEESQGTGNYQFQLTVANLLSADQSFYHAIPVETYRTPEFEVQVERDSSAPLMFGDTLHADVVARYLHGAPLVGADVHWSISRSDADFVPPGDINDGFTFGLGGTGWRHGYGFYRGPSSGGLLDQGDGQTDVHGHLPLERVLAAVDPPPDPSAETPKDDDDDDAPPRAATYTVAATVTDQNRQAIAGSSSFVVHPAAVYVGLRSDRTVVREGERFEVEAIAVDLLGERVSGRPLDLELVHRVTERKAEEKDGRWLFTYETEEDTVGTCDLESADAPARCALTPKKAGTYLLRGSTTDAEGRATRSEVVVLRARRGRGRVGPGPASCRSRSRPPPLRARRPGDHPRPLAVRRGSRLGRARTRGHRPADPGGDRGRLDHGGAADHRGDDPGRDRLRPVGARSYRDRGRPARAGPRPASGRGRFGRARRLDQEQGVSRSSSSRRRARSSPRGPSSSRSRPATATENPRPPPSR